MSETATKKKTVSYSQFSMWYSCPFRWKLEYLDGKKKFEDNLFLSFGTSIHNAMQLYLKTLYKKSAKIANRIDLVKYFKWNFRHNVLKRKIVHKPEELAEFIEDGVNILDEFLSESPRYFPPGKYELVGIEKEIETGIRNNVNIIAYLDVVLKEKETSRIKIVDIKTSVQGWNNYQKEDFTKTAQLLLYKALYSKKFSIPLSSIDVEFFIVRRKLYENSTYQQSRIQIFKPISNQGEVTKVIGEFTGFLNECFTPSGGNKPDAKFPKIPGKWKKNCKYCPHLKKDCDGVADV